MNEIEMTRDEMRRRIAELRGYTKIGTRNPNNTLIGIPPNACYPHNGSRIPDYLSATDINPAMGLLDDTEEAWNIYRVRAPSGRYYRVGIGSHLFSHHAEKAVAIALAWYQYKTGDVVKLTD